MEMKLITEQELVYNQTQNYIGYTISDSVNDSDRSSVSDSVMFSVLNSVWDSVMVSVWSSVRYSVMSFLIRKWE